MPAASFSVKSALRFFASVSLIAGIWSRCPSHEEHMPSSEITASQLWQTIPKGLKLLVMFFQFFFASACQNGKGEDCYALSVIGGMLSLSKL